MKVYLATDHTGFEIKEKIKAFLIQNSYEVEDCGALTLDPADDYPPYIAAAAKKAVSTLGASAIVFGGSGQGEAMTANKVRGARCALFYSQAAPTQAIDITGKNSVNPLEIVKLARTHNDANILSIGVRFLKEDEIINAVKIFLETKFSGEERHIRRIEQITQIENE